MSGSQNLTPPTAVATKPAETPDNAGVALGRQAAGPASPVEASEPLRLYRLVIEADERTGGFVYKTVDRETGEVVRRYPREELLNMRGDPDYNAGVVADLRA